MTLAILGQTIRNLIGGTTRKGATCDLVEMIESSDLCFDTPPGTTVLYRNGADEVVGQGQVRFADILDGPRGVRFIVGVAMIWENSCLNGIDADRGVTRYVDVVPADGAPHQYVGSA